MRKGLALGAVLVVAGCSSSGGSPVLGEWIKPSIADVDHAARISFSTRATCRELNDRLHDVNESTYTCSEHPRHCDAPGNSVGEFGCYVIDCDVHMGVALKGGQRVDFYSCDRYNGDCQSVTGGCPPPTYSCVTGRRHRLAVNPSRGHRWDAWKTCPLDSEVHPEDY